MTLSQRFEVKIPTPFNRLAHLLVWLRVSPFAFRSHHPDQYVNSLYFDSHQLACFDENLAGISHRNKMRIRWYHEVTQANNAKLEFKQKRNGKGCKLLYPLSLDFSDPHKSWEKHISECQAQLPLQALSQWDSQTCPILIGRYQRRYLVSFCGRIRATLDKDMRVFEQRYWRTPNLSDSRSMGDYVLLELKCDDHHEKLLSDLVSTCPLNPSRHSKYVNGVRHLLYI